MVVSPSAALAKGRAVSGLSSINIEILLYIWRQQVEDENENKSELSVSVNVSKGHAVVVFFINIRYYRLVF